MWSGWDLPMRSSSDDNPPTTTSTPPTPPLTSPRLGHVRQRIVRIDIKLTNGHHVGVWVFDVGLGYRWNCRGLA